MKVLHVYKTYYPDTFGGIEHVILTLSKSLSKMGITSEVFCLTSNETKSHIVDNIQVHRFKANFTIASTPFSMIAFKKFKAIAEQFDIIHYHFPYPFSDMLHLFTNIKKPTVLTYHSDIVKQKVFYQMYKPLMNRFLNNINQIIATSPGYIESSPVLQNFKSKTNLIPIGIDKNDYISPLAPNVQNLKNSFGTRFFAFIGVLRYYKGLHILIEAVRNTDIQIVIAGSGPIEDSLKKQAAGMTNIHFMGAITEQQKADLLEACYGFIFPSHLRSEAFGISLLEAAMYRKPLISCEIATGTSYINEDNVTGFVVEPNCSDQLKKAMLSLLANFDLAKEMGENAYKRYEKLFTRNQMTAAHKNIYQSILHSSN
ncbi:MAG: glycosyltransferase [Candidatus Paracaedibacteraceae bacterium]|nr:glycosyltransferase [Candidatus Paracaedibacteraceae bacterium]